MYYCKHVDIIESDDEGSEFLIWLKAHPEWSNFEAEPIRSQDNEKPSTKANSDDPLERGWRCGPDSACAWRSEAQFPYGENRLDG